MSVFVALKDKLQAVQSDISNSLRTWTSRESSPKASPQTGETGAERVSLNAGGELLNKFQKHWVSIHADSEINAQIAQDVNIQVNQVVDFCQQQHNTTTQLMFQVSALTELVKDVETVTATIEKLNSSCQHLEKALIALEDLVECEDLQKKKQHHETQYKLYHQRRSGELEKLKVKLAKDHAKKVAKYEVELREKLKERQQVFEADYQQEIENFRRTGQLHFHASSANAMPLSLSDINLDQNDQAALDEFLRSPGTPQIELAMEAGFNDEDDDEDIGGDLQLEIKQDEDFAPTDSNVQSPQELVNQPPSDNGTFPPVFTPESESQDCAGKDKHAENSVEEAGKAAGISDLEKACDSTSPEQQSEKDSELHTEKTD